MAIVEFEEGTLRIDAAVIGQGLNVEPPLVQILMREGKITALCERGVDEDAGRYRMTFFHENRRFRLVVDEGGNAIQRSPGHPRSCQPRASRESRVKFVASLLSSIPSVAGSRGRRCDRSKTGDGAHAIPAGLTSDFHNKIGQLQTSRSIPSDL